MAVQVEKDGLAFYIACAATHNTEAVGELFTWMADQERIHVEVFTEMREGLAERTLPESYPGETDAYIASLVSDRVFPSADACTAFNNESAAIATALDMEKQSILLYSGIRNLVRISEQEVMDRVIEEEREHIRRLLALRRGLDE